MRKNRPAVQACNVVEIVTPGKMRLNGLLLGPGRAKRVIVWVHGLGSSLFSMQRVARRLVDARTAVLMFNNRGHDVVSRIHTVGQGGPSPRGSGLRPREGGAAHEIFRECVDDIDGAVRAARRLGAREVYLAGHSTGCQKSVFWASKKKNPPVKAIFLLAPISDWSAEMHLQGKAKVARAAAAARALVRAGKKHALLPLALWYEPFDAQRFLSLYTSDSAEEIFTYAQPKKNPRALKSVKRPLFVLLAEDDEYADRPAVMIAEWFNAHLRRGDVRVIKGAPHGFKGRERAVVSAIRRWLPSR